MKNSRLSSIVLMKVMKLALELEPVETVAQDKLTSKAAKLNKSNGPKKEEEKKKIIIKTPNALERQ